jgi:hypothetical protein
MSIYESTPTKEQKNVSIEKLEECYNEFEDITSKSNEDIKVIQEANAELEYPAKFLKGSYVISITDFSQFFKPKLSPFGKIDMNISLSEEQAQLFLEFGENFRNYVFNNMFKLTGKMPECIEMGIDDVDMKFKLQFRESMSSYEKAPPGEKYTNFFNTVLMKKDEKYGISSFLSVGFQQMSILNDIFEREMPEYFENDSKMLRIINDTEYVVADFKKVLKTGLTEIHYDFNMFLDIKRLRNDINQELPDEVKEVKIQELKEKILEFDEKHWTFEKLLGYMSKNKTNQIIAAEISPTTLRFSNYRYNEMYEQSPNTDNQEYLDNSVFYFKNEEFIKGKKEMRQGTVSISKATKSRYQFYYKLLIFDERITQKIVKNSRPDYLANIKPVAEEPEPEPEVDTSVETKVTEDVDSSVETKVTEVKDEPVEGNDSIEVPDSDDES